VADPELRTLEDVPLETVHETFLEAFSDYLVRFDLPFWKLETMVRRRGMVMEASVGAFDGDRMVGFILNAVRPWNGRLTAYDTGTGVVPSHRKRGVTKAMFARALEVLREGGVEQYLLEVIKENEPADRLYRQQGFEEARGLSCYIGPRDAVPRGEAPGVQLVQLPVDALGWDLLTTFWDFEPSWQNSVDSVTAVPETLLAVTAVEGGQVVGYGIVEPRSGDVPQLAVAREARGRGVGGAILGRLADLAEAENLVVLNLEETSGPANAFATASGLELYTAQHEMLLQLR